MHNMLYLQCLFTQFYLKLWFVHSIQAQIQPLKEISQTEWVLEVPLMLDSLKHSLGDIL